MTVAELIAELSKYPLELEVLTEGELWIEEIKGVELNATDNTVVIYTKEYNEIK